jgi:outer membrane protein, multidrug efflux system
MRRVWCICMMFLAGCAVGPNYQAPKINVAGQWTTPLSNGEKEGPADLALWWKKFNDPDLDLLVTKAVESNYDLRWAQARVREARAERDVAYGGLWPTMSGDASYSRNRWGKNSFPPLPPTTPFNFNEYNAGFDAAWEIDIFGGTRRAVEAANAEIDAAQYSQRDVLISLLAEVARNYIQMRGFQQRLSITLQNIKIQQEILNLTNSRFKHGLSSDLDVQEATAILTQTQAQVPSLEAGVQESVYHLAVLIGQEPGALMDGLSSEKNIPLTPPQVPVGLPSDLLQRRPDIQRAERELAAATARIGQAKSDLFPKFSLTGSGGVESLSTSNWFDYASRYGSVGPTMQWEIFEAGRIRAQVRVQNAHQQEALDVYQQTILTALQDAEGALTNYAKEQVRRRSLSESFDAETQALELSTKLYKSGLADFIRVLDSERSLYLAQDTLVQSNQTVSLDLVQLYKALGGGWTQKIGED